MRSIFVLLILVMIGLNGKGQSVTALPDSVLSQCCLEVTLLNGNVTTVDWVFVQYITRDGTGTKLFVEYAPNFGGIQWETQIRIQDDFDDVLERSKFIVIPFTVGSTDYGINRNWIANIEENTTTGGTWIYGRFGTPTKRKFSAVEDYETMKNLLLACRPRAIVVAENGLYTEGDTARMGGFLIENTSITTEGYNWQMKDTLSSAEFGLDYLTPETGDTTVYWARRSGSVRQMVQMGNRYWYNVMKDTVGGLYSDFIHTWNAGDPFLKYLIFNPLAPNSGTAWMQIQRDNSFLLVSNEIANPFYTLGWTVTSTVAQLGANESGSGDPGNGVVMGAYGFGTTEYLYMITKGVDDNTATNGQYLQLVDNTNGKVEFATIDLSAYLLKSDTAAMLDPYIQGAGTLNYLPKFIAGRVIGNSSLFDNNTYAGVISRPWKFGEWTTAGRPTGTLGYFGFNTTDNIPEWYNGTVWDQTHTPWTVSGTTTSIPFTASSSAIVFTPSSSFSTGTFGFNYFNNNAFDFGMQNGAKIRWQDAGGGIATMSGSWNFPANANYPASVNLAASSSGSNDVRWIITRSGTGADQTIYAYTQRYSVDNNAPRLYTGAASFAWGTRRTTTGWQNSADSTKMFLAQNGDFWLGNTSYSGIGSYPSITTQARLNVIGRGTQTYPLLLLEALGGADRFSVLENGEVRINNFPATPTRIVGADADGDLGELALSGLSITSGVLSAQSIYNLLPTGDVQIAAANNSLRLNSLDTMKMNHAIITTPSSTNLLLLNPNVGSTGYPSGVGGGFHTNINGTIAGANAGTGHIVIGSTTVASGYNFMLAAGYASLVGGDYAIAYGYDADATAVQSMAIGYGSRADETGEISIGSANYTKFNLWTNGGDIFAKGDVIAEDSLKVTTRPSMPSATDVAVYDASGWLGYRTISSLADGNGIYSNSATLANHTTRARVPDDGNLLFSQLFNSSADSMYLYFRNYGSGERAFGFGLTDTASTGYTRAEFSSDGSGEMNWALQTSGVSGTTSVRSDAGELNLATNGGGISLSATVNSYVSVTGYLAAKQEAYNEITSTSSPQTLSSQYSDNLINQGSTQASFTFEMPPSPEDGQVCTLTYNNAISVLTLDGNGETIIGTAVTTAVAGSQRKFKFYAGIGWIKIY